MARELAMLPECSDEAIACRLQDLGLPTPTRDRLRDRLKGPPLFDRPEVPKALKDIVQECQQGAWWGA